MKANDGVSWQKILNEIESGDSGRVMVMTVKVKNGSNVHQLSPVATNVSQKHLTKDGISIYGDK